MQGSDGGGGGGGAVQDEPEYCVVAVMAVTMAVMVAVQAVALYRMNLSIA